MTTKLFPIIFLLLAVEVMSLPRVMGKRSEWWHVCGWAIGFGLPSFTPHKSLLVLLLRWNRLPPKMF